MKPKDRVSIELEEGILRIKPKPRLEDFNQKIPASEPPRSWDEITRTAYEDHAERATKKRGLQ